MRKMVVALAAAAAAMVDRIATTRPVSTTLTSSLQRSKGSLTNPPAWRRANGCARLFDFVVGDLFRALACRHA